MVVPTVAHIPLTASLATCYSFGSGSPATQTFTSQATAPI